MVNTHQSLNWFTSYSAALDSQVAALVALRQSADKRTKGTPQRVALARALKASRAVDRHYGARWTGIRVVRAQYDTTRPGYTRGQF